MTKWSLFLMAASLIFWRKFHCKVVDSSTCHRVQNAIIQVEESEEQTEEQKSTNVDLNTQIHIMSDKLQHLDNGFKCLQEQNSSLHYQLQSLTFFHHMGVSILKKKIA